MTMLLIATPSTANSAKVNRNEVGIAKPTSSAERIPSEASTTIITSAIAVMTEPSSWLTIDEMTWLWSLEYRTSTACFSSSGHSSVAASTTSFTSATVSIRLKPLRLTTCRATVVSPLKRAVPARSSNARRISARSPSVTTRSPFTLTGRP